MKKEFFAFSQRLKECLSKKDAPTATELAKEIGLSKPSISMYLAGERKPKPPTMKVLAEALNVSEDWLAGLDVPKQRKDELPEGAVPYMKGIVVPVPLVGVVNCGIPLLAEENIEGYLETSSNDLISGEVYFWLRAKGESMHNVGIRSGDLLLIRKQEDVDSGDIAVVAVNGDEATLKRVLKKENTLILQPENSSFETMVFIGEEIENVRIWGRLMEVRKHF